MSRTRIVKGNITKIIGGNYKIYSKNNIENNASKVIQIGKESGVSYGEPEKYINRKKNDEEQKLFFFFEILNHKKVSVFYEKGFPDNHTRNPFKNNKAFYPPELIFVRFARDSEYTGLSYYVPNDENATKISLFAEGMFQNLSVFNWNTYEKFLVMILKHIYRIYYPKSYFPSSVVNHEDAPVRKSTQAYTIPNEKNRWFKNDTIDPIIVFLLDNNGRLMHPGVPGNMFDILSMIDHEYKHYLRFIEIKSLLNQGQNVDDILNRTSPSEEERRTIDLQKKSKYYEKTSARFKKAMEDYYKNPNQNTIR